MCDHCLAAYLASAAAAAMCGDMENWRPTGIIQGAGLHPCTLVDAVREEVDRRNPWRSRGWPEAHVVDADAPESFTAMGIPVVSDPRVADDRIEFRDPTTGDLLAVWGPHGIFQVHPRTWGR